MGGRVAWRQPVRARSSGRRPVANRCHRVLASERFHGTRDPNGAEIRVESRAGALAPALHQLVAERSYAKL
jgi:hypothetical protein